MAAPDRKDTPKRNQSLRDFQGVNTQSARQVIGDNQFAWLENVMPIGFGNMIVPPGPSGVLASWVGTAYHMRSVNISGTDYEIVFTTNGAVYAVNLGTNAASTIAIAGKLSGSDSEICQWENTQAIIVDTKGYFSWDGVTLTNWVGTVGNLSITTIGTGYTSSPAIGFSGGGGASAAATCDINVATATIVAAGLLYNVNDLVVVAGGTFVRAAVLQVATIGAGGTITGFNLYDSGDYTVSVGVLPAAAAATTSLYGSGATFNLTFGIGPITLTNVGVGYTSAPAVAVTGGGAGGAGGAVTANLTVVPGGGTSCATYAGRVWVSSNRTVAFSAPGSFNDFSSTASGGSFIMSDETLIGTITAVRSANNFLYILGPSSVNVVADVNVVAGNTVFSNTNISASIGTNNESSILPYYRALWFANPYGIYALYGSTTQKMSDDLDGIFPLVTNSEANEIEITAGTVVIQEILCVAFLVQYNDPVNGLRALILIYFNKKWWLSSQGDTLSCIDTAIIDGHQVLYATDGSNLYKLFSDATAVISQTIVTKLWDMGDCLSNKQILKFGMEIINPLTINNITGTIDTELYTGSVPFSASNAVASWTNNLGQVITWTNNLGNTISWLSSGYGFFPMDIQTVGRYLGATITSSGIGTVYSGFHMQYEIRTPWPEDGPM